MIDIIIEFKINLIKTVNYNKSTTLKAYKFKKVCEYNDCLVSGKANDYSKLRESGSAKGEGIYAFVNEKGEALYIGVSYNRDMVARIQQHFRKDSGGLRSKLNSEQIKELEQSSIYVCRLKQNKTDILYDEAFLIGILKPKFNFLEKQEELSNV